MTTNADYTFTPHRYPEEIRDQWDPILSQLNDEGENHAAATRLRSIWKDNWWKNPDDIKRSFLNAARKFALTKTNAESPSSHVLYRAAVRNRNQDFDWGVWLVLRVVYYDVLKDADSVPCTFPPRPQHWPELPGGDGLCGSRARARTNTRTPVADHSVGNQTAGDESKGTPSHDDTKGRVKKETKEHTFMSNQSGVSLNANANAVVDDHTRRSTQTRTTQKDNSPTGNSDFASSDGMSKAASVRDSVDKSDHKREKPADSSNSSNARSDWSKSVSKSRSLSMSEDEEEDPPSDSKSRPQKRRRLSSDQSQASGSEGMPNANPQFALPLGSLEILHERMKKGFNEKLTEPVAQLVTQHVTSLQPSFKREIYQRLSERLLGVAGNSGLSDIARQITNSMTEQATTEVAKETIRQLTRQLIHDLQPWVNEIVAKVMAQNLLGNIFGADGNSES
ncbi:hypothetical protein ACHAPT_010677 [Fusarium lateritium]